MRKSSLVKSFLATISGPSTATVSRRGLNPSSTSDSTTSLSAELLSSLGRTGPKDKSASPYSSPLVNSAADVSRELHALLHDGEDAEESTSSSSEFADQTMVNNLLGIEWNPNPSTFQNARKKEITRERKKGYIFRNTDSRRYSKLMKYCAKKLGMESTLDFFNKLGRETSTKEYNALIELCISTARMTRDKTEAYHCLTKACNLLESMKKNGFAIEDANYGPILMYLVDFKMVDAFYHFCGFFKEENSSALSRFGYYEMLLCIKVSDEDKITELCESVSDDDYYLAENYFLAFCATDRVKELSRLLKVVDISKISKHCYVVSIFQALGRLELESFADKFLSDISKAGTANERFSALVYEYTTNLPNLQAKEMVLKFVSLHEKFEAVPHLLYYDKFISYFCNLNLIAEALVVVDHMCRSGLNVSVEAFDPILLACDQHCELHMVHSIYSLMREHNLGLKGETFKTLISLCVKMKDFQGAYKILGEAEEVGVIPTASMYNVIIHGFYREKNRGGVQTTLNTMKNHGVKPDSDTFSFLLSNSDSEKDISKYLEELRQAGLQITRSVCIGLIHAYCKLGNYHMAEQVVNNPDVQTSRYIAEIKSVLLSNLASDGKISDAIKIYEEIKQDGYRPESKAIIFSFVHFTFFILLSGTVPLIFASPPSSVQKEHIKTAGEIEMITELLWELKESVHWYDACCRAILYCVQHDHINDAIGLLKELRKKDEASAYRSVDQIFCHVANMEAVKLDTGMQLLRALKDDPDFHVSRTSLDFLLSMCVKARDSNNAMIVWKEYESAGLPYNVLTKLRMYQALLASGEFKDAKKMLTEIPRKDQKDLHIHDVIQSCKKAYCGRGKWG